MAKTTEDAEEKDIVIKTSEWRKQLQELVKSFHAEDLVHGALRSPNIISDGSKVMIIDFDRAGNEGEVYYPHGQLNPQSMDDRKSSADLKTTKDDDLRVLRKTLRSVQLYCDHCPRNSL
ncbi:hypothetical protein J3R83DRAFT_7306 [Lanmaoa asiatica]|nr:hypothetical protein J3R83DRAFT_7306 [Lanmaoa asiatica]